MVIFLINLHYFLDKPKKYWYSLIKRTGQDVILLIKCHKPQADGMILLYK